MRNKMMNSCIRRTFSCVAALTVAAVVGQSASAALVYEGFQYGTAGANRGSSQLLHLQPDGLNGDVDATGLGGVWTDIADPGNAGSDMFLSAGSLVYKDLATSGNSVRSDTNKNNDNFARPITASLPTTGTLWFSFLANKLQNNFSAAEGGIVIGNQQVNTTRVLDDNASTGLAGFGIAPTTSGNNWTPYAWDGSSEFVGDAVFGVPTNGSQTNLLIGKIEFDAGSGGADVFTAYHYDNAAASVTDNESNLIAIASSLEVDMNQSTLDTLSMTRQVNTHYDEIRIGTSLGEVLGLAPTIPEPSSILMGLAGLGLMVARRRG